MHLMVLHGTRDTMLLFACVVGVVGCAAAVGCAALGCASKENPVATLDKQTVLTRSVLTKNFVKTEILFPNASFTILCVTPLFGFMGEACDRAGCASQNSRVAENN